MAQKAHTKSNAAPRGKRKSRQETRDWKGFLPTPEHDDPRCHKAVKAFNYGDFKKARALSRALLASDSPDESKGIAGDILRRTGTDYVVLAGALIAVLVVLFIFFWAVSVSH